MTHEPEWPAGLEQRRPRVTENTGLGLLIGGGLGALTAAAFSSDEDMAENLLLGATSGAVIGMGVGAGMKTRPLSLEHSLRIALSKIGVDFVSLRRHGRHRAKLLFQNNSGFWVTEVQADPTRDWSVEALDDWLYRNLVIALVKKIEANA